jgi:hypothetical protein
MSRSPSAREREEWRREVALFRYTLVREPADPGLSNRGRGRLVRELTAREQRATAAIDERILTALPASNRDRFYEMALSGCRKP